MYNPSAQKSAIFNKKNRTGFEESKSTTPEVPLSAWARGAAKPIGVTEYDLQTNGSQKPRIINYGGGEISAAYTFGTKDFANRGTGYNSKKAGGVFGAVPIKRIESVRTGFPSLVVDGDGTEYSIAHTFNTTANAYQMIVSKKAKGTTAWTQSTVPSDVTGGSLWGYAAIGGVNKKTIHMVTNTLPGTDGTPYKGMDGAMLYFRSKDGGATWDKKDVQLPGMDSTRYVGTAGDNYAIATSGDNIAVVYFGQWEDTEMWFSSNNGDTWKRTTIYEFPLKLYKTDEGYDSSTLPDDPNAPTADAIFTTDQSGSVFFDKNGKVHVIYGRMYVADTDLGDNNTSYYPGTVDFIHWDETTPTKLNYLDAWPDINKNDSLDIGAEIATYFHAMTCFPSTAVADNGTIYVTYSSITEEALDGNDSNFRRIYIISSTDNGKTWSKPYPVNNDKYFKQDDFEIEFAECVFPTLAPKVDANKLHLIYQVDYTQELFLQNATQTAEDNFIAYVDIDLVDLQAGVGSKDVISADAVKFQLSPNPAHGQVQVSYDLATNSDVNITLTDILGKNIQKVNLGNQNTGKQTYSLPTNVTSGLYLVQLNINGKIATQKLMVK
jgi:Secretion system C-terminal sorting domain